MHTHLVENYLIAFKKFAEVDDKDFLYKEMDGHVVVLFDGITYVVSRAEDLKADYKNFFEKRSYEEIYTQIPIELWNFYITEKTDVGTNDLILEIYKTWESYWTEERQKILGDEQRKNKMQDDSYENLKLFFRKLQMNRDKAVQEAEAINDVELIPIIAMALYNLTKDENKESFFNECISYITKYGYDFLTDGDTFECILLADEKSYSTEGYYIYNPLFEFEDL